MDKLTAARAIVREREGEMAKKSGRRKAAIIALIAVLAALAGPSVAAAEPKDHACFGDGPGIEASWAEE